jgi:hypothetical protein
MPRKATPKEAISPEYYGDLIRVTMEEPALPLVLVLSTILEDALMTLLASFSQTVDP